MGLIRRYLRRYVRDTARLHELAQSVYAEMFGRLRRHPRATSRRIARWASYSATNALRRELRRLRRRTVAYESQLHALPEPNLDELAAAREQLERIDQLLGRFRERDREVLLGKVQGHTDLELADKLRTTPGAVRSSATRTRQALRLSLSAEDRQFALRRLAQIAMQQQSSALAAESPSS